MMPGFHARLQNARKLQPNRCYTRNSEYVVIRKASLHTAVFRIYFLIYRLFPMIKNHTSKSHNAYIYITSFVNLQIAHMDCFYYVFKV